MPSELPDIVYDTQYNVTTAVREDAGRQLRRLKRYPHFYRRLRSRQRIGGLLGRIMAVAVLDWGILLVMAATAWGAIAHRFRRPTRS